ncbi:permease [Patescibacteria group bacterium]
MIEEFTSWLVYSILNIPIGSRGAEVASFFIDDSIKIISMLVVIVFLMSFVRYYFPIAKLRDFLVSRKMFGLDYFLATVFGAMTPFCSCSSIPIFIGFLEARIPLGVTLSFLITSPLVNEVALALFVGKFGWKVAAIYAASGILVGMIGGFVLGKMGMEKHVIDYADKKNLKKFSNVDNSGRSLAEVIRLISRRAYLTTKKIIPYVIVGVGMGAVIHGYVPEGFFEKYIFSLGVWGVPLVVILAVPLYSNASSAVPVLQSLIVKGVPFGTAMAFMMATVGLSLPEAFILRRVMKTPLLAAFFSVVTMGIIIIGYLFNFIF